VVQNAYTQRFVTIRKMPQFTPRKTAAIFLSTIFLCPLTYLVADTFDQLLIDKLIEADHWKQARVLVQQRLQTNPNDPRAYYWLSKVEQNFSNIEAAIEPAEKAVALDDRVADYHAQAAEVYALMAQRGNVLKQVNYVRKMHREIDLALALDSRNLDAMLVSAVFYWKAPTLAGGDRQKALDLTTRIVSFNPTWGYLAQARLFQDEDLSRTQTALENAAATMPANYMAKMSLAQFYVTKSRPPRLTDAARLARAAIEMDPSRVAAYNILGRVYAAEGRYGDLDALLVQAEKSNPEDLSPYYFAAETLVEEKQQPERAERYLRRYLNQTPEGRAPGLPEARTLLAQTAQKPGRSAQTDSRLPKADQGRGL
jgi:tetratricopeptide (TPR) repeat protein